MLTQYHSITVTIRKSKKVKMEQIVQLNSGAKLSPHFTLGEFTRSGSHPEVYNIPSHEAIANLKRLCGWLEVLRKRYNAKYVVTISPPKLGGDRGGLNKSMCNSQSNSLDQTPLVSPYSGGRIDTPEPIRINSGYRSAQLNRKIGGAANSNHLTGCACDIKASGMEQALRYATILLDYADESKQEFDELLIEKNRYGAIWVHFAVRPSNNRRKILFINAS